ncbi:MAG: sensor domain-containing diguanylate cyclase, partial [Kofleriaceae bacterium]
TQVLGLATDVTALKDAEDRALRSEQAVAERVRVLEAILESAGEGIMVADEHARLIIANPVGRRIVGRGPSDVPLQDGIMWAHETGLFRDETEAVFPLDELPLRRALRGETLDGVDMFVKNPRYPDGIYVQATGRPVREPDGRLRGGVVMLTDVTALERARQRIAELADTDELTGLPNRRALRQRLELAAAEAARGRTFAVAIADVDHFKRVNDTHGHPTGDRVLVEVARALAQAVRRGDLVARLGGEEFCIVQADVTPSQGEALVERLRAAVAQIAAPVAVTASFGVCHSSTTAVPDEMLAAADAALYRAKAAGRNRVVLAGAAGSE